MSNTNSGKIFEKDIKDSIPNDVFYFRIKDPASSFGKDSQVTRFSPKNEFDAFLYKYPILVAMELKSNQGTSISFARRGEIGKDIKYSQIESLEKCSHYNIRAGLLLNFRKTNTTYWIDIRDFIRFMESTEKKSINEKDLAEFNAIIIPQQIKKVHYRYDLSCLWAE